MFIQRKRDKVVTTLFIGGFVALFAFSDSEGEEKDAPFAHQMTAETLLLHQADAFRNQDVESGLAVLSEEAKADEEFLEAYKESIETFEGGTLVEEVDILSYDEDSIRVRAFHRYQPVDEEMDLLQEMVHSLDLDESQWKLTNSLLIEQYPDVQQ